jgi:3-oxoacyl-[acyl-carrier-protein] synthase III
MTECIGGIEYVLPEAVLTNDMLLEEFPEWTYGSRALEKAGIKERHIASKEECASDLAVKAARKLFDLGECKPEEIDFILFCTTSPDYRLPGNAQLVQDRLGIPVTAGALDLSLGCSAYIYGLGVAHGLLQTQQAKSLLLINADTVSKHLGKHDRSSRALFGDAAAVTWLKGHAGHEALGPFVYGTDGGGAANLYVPKSGFRDVSLETKESNIPVSSPQSALYMDPQKVLDFTLERVPACVSRVLDEANLTAQDVDLFIFHQANGFLLEELRKAINIPKDKFQIALSSCGNTSSASVPIALKDAIVDGKVRPGSIVVLAGFGIGYSWGATVLRWC